MGCVGGRGAAKNSNQNFRLLTIFELHLSMVLKFLIAAYPMLEGCISTEHNHNHRFMHLVICPYHAE